MEREFTANTPNLTDRERAIIATWREYDSAAKFCADRGIVGNIGDPLPQNMSAAAVALIDNDPESFADRVREFAYARAMDRVEQQYANAIDRREGYLD